MLDGLPPVSIPGFADPVSSWSHLLGAGAMLVWGVFLLRAGHGHRGRIFALGVFVFAGTFLLSMSGVFHLLPRDGDGRAVLQRLDHAGIFLLIAGTFTPAHIMLFRGWRRWVPLILVWVCAVTGITLKTIFFNDVSESLGLTFYLGLGWVGAVSGFLVWQQYGFRFMELLIAGALAYTLGAVCEFLRWPVAIPGVLGPHEFFHLAVLAGLACHAGFIWELAHLARQGEIPHPPRPVSQNIPAPAANHSVDPMVTGPYSTATEQPTHVPATLDRR
ncbi:MAG TPA: hemolysin III family protein [Gemmatales bacterium]|nr:hemolysin III family protein [Gemmatales bacterium]